MSLPSRLSRPHLPAWAQQIAHQFDINPADLHAAAPAFTVLDSDNIQWQLEIHVDPDELLIHCCLDESGLQRDLQEMRRLLAWHHRPRVMRGACIALDERSGSLRLLQQIPIDTPRIEHVADAIAALRKLRHALLLPY